MLKLISIHIILDGIDPDAGFLPRNVPFIIKYVQCIIYKTEFLEACINVSERN